MAEQYINGEIADTWLRNFWIDKLMNEVRSAPLKSDEQSPPPPAQEAPPRATEDRDIAEATNSTESTSSPQR
jgi:hypothetical protein